MLRAENLEVWRGKTRVLDGFSLSLKANSVTALIGGNGSGKSTTLHAISGLAAIRGGRVTLDGRDITNLPPRKIVAAGLGHVPQGREVFPRLNVLENLAAGAAVIATRQRRAERIEAVLDIFPVLRAKAKLRAGDLSGGEQQQVAIGRALVPDPKLLLMDEPSAGLSPVMVDTLIDVITDLRRRGLTILLVEQNVGLAAHTSDFAVVLKSGKIVLERPASELLSDRAVLAAYLGR